MKIYSIQDCLLKIAYRNEYDLIANDMVQKIFNKIKTNLESFVLLEDNLELHLNINKEEGVDSYKNFDLTAHTETIPYDVEFVPKMIINLVVNEEFSKNDYQDLNFSLYEVIRHELEHYYKYILEKHPDEEYKRTYRSLLSSRAKEDLQKHVNLVSKYILSEIEIDSYARSIIYVAKKQNKNAMEVIQQVFNRAFFNNDRELVKLAQENQEIMAVVNNAKNKLAKRIGMFYPKFKEIWL